MYYDLNYSHRFKLILDLFFLPKHNPSIPNIDRQMLRTNYGEIINNPPKDKEILFLLNKNY